MIRFSLATLLVCIMVSAIFLSYCMSLPVADRMGYHVNMRSAEPPELLERLAWTEPVALVLTLAAIHVIRKIWQSQQREMIFTERCLRCD